MAQTHNPSSQPAETHWRAVHRRQNPDLLYAEDLGGRSSVDVEIVDSGVFIVKHQEGNREVPKELPWLAFRGAKKKLGLNTTNCKTMESIAGTGVIQRWRGWITLITVKTTYVDRMTKKTETTHAIRIAPSRPKRATGSGRDLKPENTPQEPPPHEEPPPRPEWESSDPEMDEQERAAIALADQEGA